MLGYKHFHNQDYVDLNIIFSESLNPHLAHGLHVNIRGVWEGIITIFVEVTADSIVTVNCLVSVIFYTYNFSIIGDDDAFRHSHTILKSHSLFFIQVSETGELRENLRNVSSSPIIVIVESKYSYK